MFEIATSNGAKTLHLDLTGELDIASVPSVEEALAAADGSAFSAVEIDVGGLSFMDSTGIRCLLSSAKRCQALGLRFRVTGTDNPPVSRLLEIAGLSDFPPFSQG